MVGPAYEVVSCILSTSVSTYSSYLASVFSVWLKYRKTNLHRLQKHANLLASDSLAGIWKLIIVFTTATWRQTVRCRITWRKCMRNNYLGNFSVSDKLFILALVIRTIRKYHLLCHYNFLFHNLKTWTSSYILWVTTTKKLEANNPEDFINNREVHSYNTHS